MLLYIVRHGEARSQAATDAERPLTDHGRAQVLGVWRRLAERGVHAGRLVASPYRRAQQTARCISEVYRGMPQEACGFLVPEAAVAEVLDWLMAQPQEDGLVLVSHMPLVAELTGLLTEGRGARVPFSVGTVACLDMEVPAAGGARLLWMHSPETARTAP